MKTIKKISLLVLTVLLSANSYCQVDTMAVFISDGKDTLMSVYPILIMEVPCQEVFIQQKPKLYKNSIAPIMQLDSYSFGARYERRGDRIGGYAYGIIGDFPLNPSGINVEKSIGAGFIFMPKYWEYPYCPAMTMGLNYSEYTYYESLFPFQDTHADMPVSLDMGLSAQHGRINFGVNSDIVKWRWMIFIGFNF